MNPRGAARTASALRAMAGVRIDRRVSWSGLSAIAIVAVVLPWAMGPSAQSTYVTMGLAVIVTVGLTLLMGFGGQISLGQAAFYMVGAYISGILAAHGVPTLLALVAAPVGTAALAAIVGVPLLRLRGNYLAFATLALQLIFLAVITDESGLTGGEIGLQGFPALTIGATLSATVFAAVVWALAMLSLLLGANLVSSRAGRGLQAIAAGESSAAAVGVPVAAYKLRLFVIAGAMAGLAGGLYAFSQQYLSTDAFPIILSVEFLVMAAVGGLGSIPGALVGAVVVTLLQNELNSLGTVSGLPTNAPQIFSLGVYGVLLTMVMLFFPRGLLPGVIAGLRRLIGGRMPGPAEPGVAAAAAGAGLGPAGDERRPALSDRRPS